MLSFTYYCLINYVYKFAPLQRLLSNDKSKKKLYFTGEARSITYVITFILTVVQVCHF